MHKTLIHHSITALFVLALIGCGGKEDAPLSAPKGQAPSVKIDKDFVLQCKKYYSGSGTTVSYFLGFSEDKKSGYFVYQGNFPSVYALSLVDKSDTEYSYSLKKYASVNGEFIGFTGVNINRQTLQLQTKIIYGASSTPDSNFIDCEQENLDFLALVQDIKNKDEAFRDAKNAEALTQKIEQQKNTKF